MVKRKTWEAQNTRQLYFPISYARNVCSTLLQFFSSFSTLVRFSYCPLQNLNQILLFTKHISWTKFSYSQSIFLTARRNNESSAAKVTAEMQKKRKMATYRWSKADWDEYANAYIWSATSQGVQNKHCHCHIQLGLIIYNSDAWLTNKYVFSFVLYLLDWLDHVAQFTSRENLFKTEYFKLLERQKEKKHPFMSLLLTIRVLYQRGK